MSTVINNVPTSESPRRVEAEGHAALGAYLEALLSRFGLRAAALSDGFGMVVGRGRADARALGALGERCARGQAPGEEEFERTTGGADLYAHALSVAGRTMYLATLGARVRGLHRVTDELSAFVA
ncbi:MAG: hypothetical protein MUF34_20610 [Polyangiaceae bacterium]|jgi:hypothetical protein|nr:hypothetical protein [Polyangiaceae bacterium]